MIGVAVFLTAMGLWNFRLLLNPALSLAKGQISFPKFVESVQNYYTESLSAKYDFVNLNGWFAWLTKQTFSNDVVWLNNGMLGVEQNKFDNPSANANSMIEFNRFLLDHGIPFLFIQAPHKMDPDCTLLPVGVANVYNANAGALIEVLEEGGVRVLDLRASIAGTPELVEQNFFITDHHWTYTGALTAFREIVREIESVSGESELDFSRADPSHWESHVLENAYLGSQGQRTGIYFAGMDDFVYYTPKPADMRRISCAIFDTEEFYRGDFSDAILREERLSARDYFDSHLYYLYVGGGHSLVQLRNPDAPNDLKILIIKDSFATPILGYASVLFREVDVIDPRHYNGSIAEYALFSQPDIVIELLTTVSDSVFYTYGLETVSKDTQDSLFEAELVRDGSISIELAPGQAYVLTFDDVELEGSAATVALYDSYGKRIDSAIFDVEYCRENGGFSALFCVPGSAGENLELRFHAGTDDAASDGSATYRSVRLESFDPA